ncbi:Imm32 family immunity protein [Pseudomonas helleri]|uniref:Uncharacterized protein n=1 Tax=Pseudomonas helleri TaxID=1608996 RepID=A0A7X2CHS1_9PSED|nr:hypothetical protein [Pseudomonas helleri]MQT75164.1 hypothetical protein [Pseudomonas helleri]MQT96252.1 hypothetical protein [Pseudomonas helleri]MQU31639.1 hypothetical protein [Pseudomonas helleri]
MNNLKTFAIYGSAESTCQEIKLDEISIVADAQTLRLIGSFLTNSAKKMEANDVEHIHFQDIVKNFSHENHVDIIVINKDVVLTTK